MAAQSTFEKRKRLGYLALYYAIHNDEVRSDRILRLMRRLKERNPSVEAGHSGWSTGLEGAPILRLVAESSSWWRWTSAPLGNSFPRRTPPKRSWL